MGVGGSPGWTWRKRSGVPAASTPSQSATNLLAGVAVSSENASWLIASVLLGDGFPLELGVVATDREPTGGVRFAGF